MPQNHIPGKAGELKSLRAFGTEKEKTLVGCPSLSHPAHPSSSGAISLRAIQLCSSRLGPQRKSQDEAQFDAAISPQSQGRTRPSHRGSCLLS